MANAKLIRKIGLITGGVLTASSITIAGFGIGMLLGMYTRDTLAQIAAGTLQSVNPDLMTAFNVGLPTCFGAVGLFLLLMGARHHYHMSVLNKQNVEYWASQGQPNLRAKPSIGGPVVMITGTSLMTFGICTGIGQAIEQATLEQIDAIFISTGLVATLAAIAFITSYILAQRIGRVEQERIA